MVDALRSEPALPSIQRAGTPRAVISLAAVPLALTPRKVKLGGEVSMRH
jgi:hypothetical protein